MAAFAEDPPEEFIMVRQEGDMTVCLVIRVNSWTPAKGRAFQPEQGVFRNHLPEVITE